MNTPALYASDVMWRQFWFQKNLQFRGTFTTIAVFGIA